MSDSESKVKVTDKRMFTADGELREDFRELEDAEMEKTSEARPRAEERGAARTPEEASSIVAAAAAAQPAGVDSFAGTTAGADREPTAAEASQLPPQPSFFDLLGLLTQPIPLYLGDAQLEGGRSVEDLDTARFYIDLLDVLKEKTAGNLSAEESALLEDLLYRLRLRYVEKTG